MRQEQVPHQSRPADANTSAGPAPVESGASVDAREVFDILVRENERMLAAFLHGLVRERSVVDDLFQETLLTAWRKLPEFDTTRPFGPWLRGIASRIALRHRERGGRGFAVCTPEALAELERDHATLPAGQEGFALVRERLEECLTRLPEKLREVVQLIYGRGLSLKEAAERASASLEASKKRLQRARTSLRDCLRDGGIEP